MLAEFVRLADHEVVDRVQLGLLDLEAADAVLRVGGARRALPRLLADLLAVVVAPRAARLAVRLRVPLVLIQSLLDRLWCVFGFVVGGWWLSGLFENLQFGQRDDITILRLVPDGLLRGTVVVVEAVRLVVEQLPPLGRVGPLDGNTLRTKTSQTLR